MELFLAAICLGLIPALIARSKGQKFGIWWLYGTALFPVALAHSLVIKADREELEREQLQSGTSRKCPFCAEIIKREARVCRFCSRDLLPAEPPLVLTGQEPHSRPSASKTDTRVKVLVLLGLVVIIVAIVVANVTQ
jgi:hypothetical protein